MKQIDVKVQDLEGNFHSKNFQIERMYNFGSATRDPDAAIAHQEEVAKSGIFIASNVPAPRIYPI